MGDISLKGRIIGFEEYEDYVLVNLLSPESPFRLLKCVASGFCFVVVNPFTVAENYTFDVQDDVLAELQLTPERMENLTVLCIVRYNETNLYVNLRSPLVFNTETGLFRQVILENEAYPVSTPFKAKAVASSPSPESSSNSLRNTK